MAAAAQVATSCRPIQSYGCLNPAHFELGLACTKLHQMVFRQTLHPMQFVFDNFI
jgi:hypothetical protein